MPKKEASHRLLRASQAAEHIGVAPSTLETRYRHLHILRTPGRDRRLSLPYLEGAERFAEAWKDRYSGKIKAYAHFGETEDARSLVAAEERWLSTVIGNYAVSLSEEPDEAYVWVQNVNATLNVSEATIPAWEKSGRIAVYRHKRIPYIAQAALLGPNGGLSWQRPALMPDFDVSAMNVPLPDAQE